MSSEIAHKGFTKAELQQAVAAIPHWFHSIDLGQGVVTPGDKSPARHQKELAALRLPDLHGKSVLDIGAWDGFYTFAAERLGARRVVSLDHFVWALNRARATEIQTIWQNEGVAPKPFEETDAWQPETLPGKRGYDLAHRVLRSHAECHVGNFIDADYEELGGAFDVVLWLGVLYHMRNPLLALEKVAAATKEVAIIESAAATFPHDSEHAMCEFLERDELGGDFTNWWVPNEKALVGMCRAVGFHRVDLIQGAPTPNLPPRSFWRRLKQAGGHVLREFNWLPPLPPPSIMRYRIIIHAWK